MKLFRGSRFNKSLTKQLSILSKSPYQRTLLFVKILKNVSVVITIGITRSVFSSYYSAFFSEVIAVRKVSISLCIYTSAVTA